MLTTFTARILPAIRELTYNSPRFKLPAFSEEAESRLVSVLPVGIGRVEYGLTVQDPTKIKLRVKSNGLAPYIILKPTIGLLPVREVITGPALKLPSSLYALKAFLINNKHQGVSVKKSQFSLRLLIDNCHRVESSHLISICTLPALARKVSKQSP